MVDIEAVYAGSYQDTITKVLTAVRGGNPPQLSVILAVDMFTLIEEDAIIPFDDLITSDDEGRAMDATASIRRSWRTARPAARPTAIPFQRSTPVLYWNKEAFKPRPVSTPTRRRPPGTRWWSSARS